MQAEEVRISRQATQIALNEYRAGTQDFTTVVTAEAQQLSAEENELSTRAQLQFAAVNLIVALGGGWTRGEAAGRSRRNRRSAAPFRRQTESA